MSKKIIYFIVPLLFLVFVSAVSAENGTTESAQSATASSAQRKTNALKKVDELKTLIQTKKDQFKARVQTIKDQKKKALAERIDAKMARINEKQSLKFSEALTILQKFLDKIKQSATNTKVLNDIAAAQSSLDTAKKAVETQAGKAYTMEIADETTLKLNAGTAVSQLRQDLTAVHKLVVDAKQAVQKLNTDRKMIKKEATSSAKL